MTGKKPGELLILWTNSTYFYCPGRLYGDYYAFGAFASEVAHLCPSQSCFHFQQNWILYYGKQIVLETAPWDLVVTRTEIRVGNPVWKEGGTVWQYRRN